MTLIELIAHFRNGGDIKTIYVNNKLNFDSEVIEVFMLKTFDLDSKLKFIEIEKTEGKRKFEFEGIEYFEIFDLYNFQDMLSDFLDNREKSNSDIAKDLINYIKNDA